MSGKCTGFGEASERRLRNGCTITKFSDIATKEPHVDQPNPIDLYRRATQRCIAVVEGIEPSQLDDPTPCSEWNVQQLLDHLVGGTAYLRTASGDEAAPPEGAAPGDLRSGVDACLARFAEPGVLDRTCASPLGFEWTVGQAVAGTFMDVLIHTWDLAAATGQDSTLDAELVAACAAMFLPDMPENGRAAGLIGPAVEVGADATPQQILLGALGRQG